MIPERGLKEALHGFTPMEQKFINEVAKKITKETQYPIDLVMGIALKKPINDSKLKYYNRNIVTFYINPIIYNDTSNLRYHPEMEVTTVWQDPTVIYSDDGRTMEFTVGVKKPLEDYTLELFGGFWEPLERPLKDKDSLIISSLSTAFEQNTYTEIEFLTSLGLKEAHQRYGFSIIISPIKYELTLYTLKGKKYEYEEDEGLHRRSIVYTLLIDAHTSSITSVTKFDPTFMPTPEVVPAEVYPRNIS